MYINQTEKESNELARRLLKKYFDSEIIFTGFTHYLNIKQDKVKFYQEDDERSGFQAIFTIPIDGVLDFIVSITAKGSKGTMREDYRENTAFSIIGNYRQKIYKKTNNSIDQHLYEKKVSEAYSRKFIDFQSFLYHEFEKWVIAIRKEGFTDIYNGFLAVYRWDHEGKRAFEQMNRNRLSREDISWEEFIEKGRRRYNPILRREEEARRKKGFDEKYRQSSAQNSGCLLYVLIGISAILSISSFIY